MPPTVYPYPVKRPGFIIDAFWNGNDDDLNLKLVYQNLTGQNTNIELKTRNAERRGNVCLPNSNDVLDLGEYTDEGTHEKIGGEHYYSGEIRDIVSASASMAVHIRGQGIPGSQEFEDSLLNQLLSANWLQTAIGTVKLLNFVALDDKCFFVEAKQGSGPGRYMLFDYASFLNYNYVPQTQLLTVPGAIEKQFASYKHDYPNDVLSQNQKDDIVEYVKTLEQWI